MKQLGHKSPNDDWEQGGGEWADDLLDNDEPVDDDDD